MLRSRRSRCRFFCSCLIEWVSRTIFDFYYDRFLNAQNILRIDCWCFEYFNILLIVLLLCRLNVVSMKMKVLKYKYFIVRAIISLLLYLMSTRQSHDFIKVVNARRNNYKLATKTFVLFQNLKHSERDNEDDNVAKNRYVAKFIKKTSFAFFKSLIVNMSYFFKKQFQLIYHDFEIIC